LSLYSQGFRPIIPYNAQLMYAVCAANHDGLS